MKNIILTTQITKVYFEKSIPLFDSVRHNWKKRFVVGCIGFVPPFTPWFEWFYVPESEVKSHRENWPLNRKNYYCMQAGEFIDYISCNHDDIIICIDADTIMQRTFSNYELEEINSKLKNRELLSVYGAYPETSLANVLFNNLKCKLNITKVNQLFENKSWIDKCEFTASILIANKNTFITLKYFYLSLFDKMTKLTDHHAGTQWLVNYIAYSYFKCSILGNNYQCADWYIDFKTQKINDKLCINGKPILFNHTKYNGTWNYK